MDRDTFFSRPARPKTTEITLDDGQVVKARKLSQSEVENIRKRYSSDEKALEGFRYIVARCVVDDDGKRMFADDDTAKLAEIEFDTIQAIALEVSRFSGLNVPKNT